MSSDEQLFLSLFPHCAIYINYSSVFVCHLRSFYAEDFYYITDDPSMQKISIRQTLLLCRRFLILVPSYRSPSIYKDLYQKTVFFRILTRKQFRRLATCIRYFRLVADLWTRYKSQQQIPQCERTFRIDQDSNLGPLRTQAET